MIELQAHDLGMTILIRVLVTLALSMCDIASLGVLSLTNSAPFRLGSSVSRPRSATYLPRSLHKSSNTFCLM